MQRTEINEPRRQRFGERPVPHTPTEEEEVLAVSGSDFEGQMRLARMSLGLSLWQQQLAEEDADPGAYFDGGLRRRQIFLNGKNGPELKGMQNPHADQDLSKFIVRRYLPFNRRVEILRGNESALYQDGAEQALGRL